jgi:hypothetical protein
VSKVGLLLAVARAADVGMDDRRAVPGTLCSASIKLVVEDGADRSVGERADLDGTGSGGFQTCGTNARASRRMPRQDRKPCSGCGLCSRIGSQSAAVAGPMRAPAGCSRSRARSDNGDLAWCLRTNAVGVSPPASRTARSGRRSAGMPGQRPGAMSA